MNIFKNLRKPYLSLFLSGLILFVSCSSNGDIDSKDNKDISEAKAVQSLIELNEILINQKESKLSENELILVYQNWLNKNNYDYVYKLPKKKTDSKASKFSNDVVLHMKSSEEYSQFQINLIEMIDNDFKANNNVKNSLVNIKEMRLSDSYSVEEKEILTILSICIQFFDATLSDSDSYYAKLLSAKWLCYLSIAGIAISTAGLAALTGGASLAVMAGVVGGYTIESILLVASCRCHFKGECG